MKTWTARRFSWAVSGVFAACLAFAAHGSTNVFNDAVFWFRGGRDLNGDHYMQQGEFFDDLHADDPAHDNHRMSMSTLYYTGISAAFLGNAVLQEEPVVFPALGTNVVKAMQVLKISNIRETVANKFYFPFDVNPHSIFERNNISNEYTIVGRIRLDHGGNFNKCFVKVGYNASEKQGMWLGFSPSYPDHPGCMRVAAFRTPSSGGSDTSASFSLPVPTNTWVDLAVVVGNSKIRVGVATPASLTSHGNNPTIAFDEKPMWTDNCKLIGSEHYKLFCLDGQTEYKDAGNADTSCFLGSVQQLAIWGRALSDQEVMEAFGMPRPALLRIGFDNGNSHEFGGVRSSATQTIDGLGSWQNIANTMEVGDIWTVKFTPLRDEVGLPQIFSIKSLPNSATATIEPILNDHSLGEMRIAKNGRAFWPVPKNLIVAGENMLALERKNGGGNVFIMDAMELGGSLGVGTVSESSTDDGRTGPECTKTGVPSAADPNPQHCPTKLEPSTGIKDLHFRVWVDPAVADKASFTFRTAVKGDVESTEFFTVYVNNASRTKVTAIPQWKQYSFNPGQLQGGWNDFDFYSQDSRCWEFDCYRFETVLPSAFSNPEPPGLSIFVR